MDYNQFPLGIELALASDQADKEKFNNLSDDEKKEYLERNRSALSQKEIDRLVAQISGEEDDMPQLEDISGIFKGPSIG